MFGWSMEEEAKLEFTITVNWVRKDGASRRRDWGRLTTALAARPKMWVCNSRTPSQFSGGYKRLWSANNCSNAGEKTERQRVEHDHTLENGCLLGVEIVHRAS
jgi:hypothetical protein